MLIRVSRLGAVEARLPRTLLRDLPRRSLPHVLLNGAAKNIDEIVDVLGKRAPAQKERKKAKEYEPYPKHVLCYGRNRDEPLI